MKYYMYFFLIFLFFILIINVTLSCYSKQNGDSGDYIAYRKFSDTIYLEQLKKLDECLESLPKSIINRSKYLIDIWADDALKEVKSKFSFKDKERLDIRGFIKCFNIIAQHNAERFICAGFDILKGREDKLLKYAILEYDECITQKNNPYINSLDFERPKIGYSL